MRSLELKNRCYKYVFEQYNPMITSVINPYMPYVASTHAAELPYIFNTNIYMSPWYKTKADRKVQNIITTMLCNFAKFGDPNSNEFDFKWDQISPESPDQHLVIKAEPVMRKEANIDRIERLSSAFELLMK
jgi:carboxylesterase type B